MTTNPAAVEQRLFTRKDAATYLGLSVHTLRKLQSNGALPAYRSHPSGAGRVLFRREDLDAYIASLVPAAAYEGNLRGW